MKTIFEKIIDREFPAVLVYEDESHIALMDKFPAISGQVLVIPKKPIDYIFDMEDADYQALWALAKKVGTAMHQAFSAKRVCMLVEGFHVPHVHIKLYPVREGEHLEVHMGPEAPDTLLEEQARLLRELL